MCSQTAAEAIVWRTAVNRLATMSYDSLLVESRCSAAVVVGLFEKVHTHTHTYTTFSVPFCVGGLPHTVKWRRLLLLLFYNRSSAHHRQHVGSDARSSGGEWPRNIRGREA